MPARGSRSLLPLALRASAALLLVVWGILGSLPCAGRPRASAHEHGQLGSHELHALGMRAPCDCGCEDAAPGASSAATGGQMPGLLLADPMLAGPPARLPFPARAAGASPIDPLPIDPVPRSA